MTHSIKRRILFFFIFSGIVVGTFGISYFTGIFSTPSDENMTGHQNEIFKIGQNQSENDTLLSGILPDPSNVQEVKSYLNCSELKAENAPNLQLSFSQEPSYSEPQTGCFFENYLSDIPIEADFLRGLLQSENEISLVSPFPPLALIETPPLTECVFENALFDEFGVLAGSEHFDVQVEYAPKRSRPGYVFKITLLPHSDVPFKKIQQNFYFLLDRSNSIPRARYLLNKKAVSEALDFLKPSDTFNILIFAEHVVRLREKNLQVSAESIAEARDFLERQAHGGLFAATELYASLGKIIPLDVAENEINTAILLSDGDTYLSQEKQRQTIGGWTARNKGKVSLYTVASGTGNNLALLDLLSSFNKGVLIYSQDNVEINNRLAYLMRTIQNPIGKQIIATAVCEDKSMTVLLQPKSSRIPDLYQNRPFVIYGTTNRLSNFILFLQGRYYDQSFDIKKMISFEKAKLGTYSIERAWTQLLVHEFYERYFEEGNPTHLETAKQLLAPLNLPMPLIN